MTETIASRVERRLQELDLSPITAATAAGLPRDTIRDIVRGKSLQPSHATLVRVAKALSWTIEDLTGEKREQDPEFLGFVLEWHHRLDWELCLLFTNLVRLPPDEADIVYFALAPSARTHVLKELKQLRYPDLYEEYWQSLLREIGIADNIFLEFQRFSRPAQSKYSQEDLREMYHRFGVIEAAVLLFRLGIMRGLTREQGADALRVPLVIPPPKGHPFGEHLKIYPFKVGRSLT